MTDPATVLAKVKADLEAWTHNSQPMFPGGVHVGVANVPAKSWASPPLAIISSGAHDPDEDEPELGNFTINVDLYAKDTTGNYGENTALGVDDVRAKAALETIRQYLRNNYAYKAGGDYGAAMFLSEGPSEIEPATELDEEPPEGDDDFPTVFITTAVYTVIES